MRGERETVHINKMLRKVKEAAEFTELCWRLKLRADTDIRKSLCREPDKKFY
jgi:hypothetical protein